mmetsp:Transcript_5254/g.21498  ORF Transcript_5254/g.21498 Transcript_5254/m.21498 type:complete len:279 (+) Transcript_5254:165-1001(+)
MGQAIERGVARDTTPASQCPRVRRDARVHQVHPGPADDHGAGHGDVLRATGAHDLAAQAAPTTRSRRRGGVRVGIARGDRPRAASQDIPHPGFPGAPLPSRGLGAPHRWSRRAPSRLRQPRPTRHRPHRAHPEDPPPAPAQVAHLGQAPAQEQDARGGDLVQAGRQRGVGGARGNPAARAARRHETGGVLHNRVRLHASLHGRRGDRRGTRRADGSSRKLEGRVQRRRVPRRRRVERILAGRRIQRRRRRRNRGGIPDGLLRRRPARYRAFGVEEFRG